MLSNKEIYPNYMRLVVSDSFNAMIYAQLLVFYGYREVNIIYED